MSKTLEDARNLHISTLMESCYNEKNANEIGGFGYTQS